MSKLPYSEPVPSGSNRARIAKEQRDLATEVARLAPQATTRTNGEETDHRSPYPANFTKGLLHNECGVLEHEDDYACFVEAINSPDSALFDKSVPTAETRGVTFSCQPRESCDESDETKWRGWESPRSGHAYDLQGPDCGAVGMAPAPRIGSSELAAEMAEVYGLAILRDVPFTTICKGGDEKLCDSPKEGGSSLLSAKAVVDALNQMPFYSGLNAKSSTPLNAENGFNRFERNRRFARTQSLDGALNPENAFRGSTPGALVGPYVSQFMLIGANSIAGPGGGTASYPGTDASFDLQDGYIPYGSLIIDQRTITHKNCLDHMTDWCSWLDVQNGANFKGADLYEESRRFITTPRDLATYVHFDALYEAYLNAGLILLAMQVPHSKGFPEPSRTGRRDAFATFGGPHILSLVTEVATRCLKAVRRQKFNYHRRARPEAIAGRLTLAKLGLASKLGCSKGDFESTLADIPAEILHAIVDHNREQNTPTMNDMRMTKCNCCYPTNVKPDDFAKANLLLPMAFPEGSPMHPAYGAGHATVAGGCVTMLKAFFEMFEDCDSGKQRALVTSSGAPIVYVPNDNGTTLTKDKKCKGPLTIQGELDKLAANISIGRNMAGVHYYSDYYDSLRMGERVAVGILLQQAPTYGELVEITFTSFDGDLITISGDANSCPSLSVQDRNGKPIAPDEWWLRHVVGQEFSEDLSIS